MDVKSLLKALGEKEETPARQSIVINVGGSRFETFVDTLKKRPRTMLANLSANSPYYRESCGEYFFDRDPVIFRAVLDFYRNQTLHFPHDVCGTVVRRELQYWKIDEKHVAPCCWQFFKTVSENQATVELLSRALEPADDASQMEERSRCQRLAWRVWTFTEDPTSSRFALVRAREINTHACMHTRTHARVPNNGAHATVRLIFTSCTSSMSSHTDITIESCFVLCFSSTVTGSASHCSCRSLS